jgi:hypothetical protein
MLLEGAMALMLVHSEPRYAVAAAKAAKSLVREAALTLRQATASGAPGT